MKRFRGVDCGREIVRTRRTQAFDCFPHLIELSAGKDLFLRKRRSNHRFVAGPLVISVHLKTIPVHDDFAAGIQEDSFAYVRNQVLAALASVFEFLTTDIVNSVKELFLLLSKK